MSVYKRGGSYYIDISLGGHRINRKIPGTTIEEAKKSQEIIKNQYCLSAITGQPFQFQKRKSVRSSRPLPRISEYQLECYVVKHCDEIEEGLKFLYQQKFIGTGNVDIFAKDKDGKQTIVELKAGSTDLHTVDTITGQLSRYLNSKKYYIQRIILVVPESQSVIEKFYAGLKHWIDLNIVQIITFDYLLYAKRFIFKPQHLSVH